jgi:mono/diheme cytochrome c family protein
VALSPAVATAFLFFDNESSLFDRNRIDLGEFIEGKTYSREIKLKNTSKQVITIDSIDVSCGCTEVEASSNIVMPGDHVSLNVKVDTSGKSGPVTKSIYIRTNASFEPFLLELTSNINQHPTEEIDSLAIFRGDCARCHVGDNIERKVGKDLYNTACSICHREGPGFASSGRKAFMHAVSYGVDNSTMPGFLKERGGPLTNDQIASLADYILKPLDMARKELYPQDKRKYNEKW